MIVLDASAVGPMLIPDEIAAANDDPIRFLADTIHVPAHWRLEVANMLRSAMRRSRLTAAQRSEALNRLASVPVVMDDEGWDTAWHATIALADRHNLTPYDAAYLELAMRRGAAMLTYDKALRDAALAEGITILP